MRTDPWDHRARPNDKNSLTIHHSVVGTFIYGGSDLGPDARSNLEAAMTAEQLERLKMSRGGGSVSTHLFPVMLSEMLARLFLDKGEEWTVNFIAEVREKMGEEHQRHLDEDRRRMRETYQALEEMLGKE